MMSVSRLESPEFRNILLKDVCVELDPQSLCRLMATNSYLFMLLISDDAWFHFYSRLVQAMPTLKQNVFKWFPWKMVTRNRGLKRAKKNVISFPSGGYWYVMRHYIMPACSINGIRALCKSSDNLGHDAFDPLKLRPHSRVVHEVLLAIAECILIFGRNRNLKIMDRRIFMKNDLCITFFIDVRHGVEISMSLDYYPAETFCIQYMQEEFSWEHIHQHVFLRQLRDLLLLYTPPDETYLL